MHEALCLCRIVFTKLEEVAMGVEQLRITFPTGSIRGTLKCVSREVVRITNRLKIIVLGQLILM